MQRILTALAFVAPAVILAGGATAAPLPKKKIPAIAMLPDGSELKGVMLPRYDENRKLIGALKAEKIILVDTGQIAGEAVSVEFFNPDQSPRGRIDLKKAIFHQDNSLLVANESVEIKSERMSASGSGLYYSFEQGDGFLLGPATTTILPAPTETTMRSPNPPLRATAALGVSLLTQSLHAAPPPEITAAEKAAIHADAASKAPAAAAASTAARADLEADLAAAAAASKAAATFLAQTDLPPTPANAGSAAVAQPLDIQPAANDTVIHCEGGMYFDADEGVLVYLKNVTVKDPRFDLSGADELKIFFGKKPAKADKPDASAKPGLGANFGDVERIVATGAVKINQQAAAGKEPIQASGAIFTYNVKAGQIILSGGFPWVLQGKTYMRAKEPQLMLRIFPKTGSFITEGNWEMGGNLAPKP